MMAAATPVVGVGSVGVGAGVPGAVPRRSRRKSPGTRVRNPGSHLGGASPMAQLGFEGSRHEVPERLPSARGKRVSSMRVIDMSDDTLENILALGGTLRRLDLSSVGLRALGEEVPLALPNLERLDMSHNELTNGGLPTSLAGLDNLAELSLHHNCISGAVPRVIHSMKSLHRLKLAANHITSVDGLEKLGKLTMLILDDNKIAAFQKALYAGLNRLQYFHCSGNRIRDVLPEVRLWRYLKDLNFSHNDLTYLPAEVFLLPRIDALNASSNKITRLPSLVIKGKMKRLIALVDLSDNRIVKFPDYLLMMTRTLDLSRNQIRTIPGGIINKLDYNTDQVLCLDGNQLTNPPADVCDCGIRSIIQFFLEVRAEMRVHQGLKVLVIGEMHAGKTSMVQSMVDGQSRLSEKSERTLLVDLYEVEYDLDDEGPLGRKLQLALWDFSGHPAYMYPASLFQHQPALTMIVFNMATYKPEDFQSTIARWIDWVIVRKNKIVMLVVGTHADKVRRRRAQTMCAEISKAIKVYIQKYLAVIQREIKKIESLPHISPALSEQLKQYIHLLKVQITIHPQVVPVSSVSLQGFSELQSAIVTMAGNKQAFPHVLRVIPSLWVDVEKYIDDKAWNLQVPLVRWSDYVQEIVGRFGMAHLVEQITTYLHETGRVLWFSEHAQLRDYVILRPSWFSDLLKALFRHDMATYDFGHDENLKQSCFNKVRLEGYRKELLEKGIMDRELLRYLWSSHIPTDNTKVVHEVVHLLVEHFEVGYVMDRPGVSLSSRASSLSLTSSDRSSLPTAPHSTPRHGATSRTSSKSKRRGRDSALSTTTTGASSSSAGLPGSKVPPSALPFPFSRLLVPWLRCTPQPPAFGPEYERHAPGAGVVANFRFPRYIPAGFFETLTVRAQLQPVGLATMFHWRGGLYARHRQLPVRFCLLRIDHQTDGSTCVRAEVRVEVRPAAGCAEVRPVAGGVCAPEVRPAAGCDEVRPGGCAEVSPTGCAGPEEGDVAMLWSVLLPLLRETDKLIAKFKGVRVERHMECPECHGLSFLGEWQTPKELQGLGSRVCETCKTAIPTACLIQPKEKKKDEEVLKKLFLKRKQRHLEESLKLKANEVAREGDGSCTKPEEQPQRHLAESLQAKDMKPESGKTSQKIQEEQQQWRPLAESLQAKNMVGDIQEEQQQWRPLAESLQAKNMLGDIQEEQQQWRPLAESLQAKNMLGDIQEEQQQWRPLSESLQAKNISGDIQKEQQEWRPLAESLQAKNMMDEDSEVLEGIPEEQLAEYPKGKSCESGVSMKLQEIQEENDDGEKQNNHGEQMERGGQGEQGKQGEQRLLHNAPQNFGIAVEIPKSTQNKKQCLMGDNIDRS